MMTKAKRDLMRRHLKGWYDDSVLNRMKAGMLPLLDDLDAKDAVIVDLVTMVMRCQQCLDNAGIVTNVADELEKLKARAGT